jgi:segregation and condensation protein A
VAGEHLEQAADQPVDSAPQADVTSSSAFSVTVGSFEGPFDLLLQLISKHKLEVTELALHVVTDEFIAHLRAQGPEWDLDETTEFLVVAATLLDLKAARLLPSGEVEDEEDLALLEARDLLFARLLQYRAYKEVSALFAERMSRAARQVPRTVGLEPHFADLLPEVVLGLGPDAFAALAAKALTPRIEPEVSVSHLHVPLVSVREQAAIIVGRLRRQRTTTFRALVSDAATTMVVIGRFLALLELFREGSVSFEQVVPLGDLTIRWTGSDDGDIEVRDEYDDFDDEAESEGDAPDDSPDDDMVVAEDTAVEVEEVEP